MLIHTPTILAVIYDKAKTKNPPRKGRVFIFTNYLLSEQCASVSTRHEDTVNGIVRTTNLS